MLPFLSMTTMAGCSDSLSDGGPSSIYFEPNITTTYLFYKTSEGHNDYYFQLDSKMRPDFGNRKVSENDLTFTIKVKTQGIISGVPDSEPPLSFEFAEFIEDFGLPQEEIRAYESDDDFDLIIKTSRLREILYFRYRDVDDVLVSGLPVLILNDGIFEMQALGEIISGRNSEEFTFSVP